MKKQLLITFYLLSFTFAFSQNQNNGQRGIFESYAILNINSGSNVFYDMQANTANPDLNGANLGTFSCNQSLVVKGGQNKTYKNSGCNITNGDLFYRVYSGTGTGSGSFTQINLPFAENLPSPGDQRWESQSGTNNIISGLFPGTYTLEIYSRAQFDGCGFGDIFSNNSGANYKAIFTVGPAPIAGITNNSGTTVLTCSQTSISVTATGGVSYSWDNALGAGATKSIVAPGTYTVTATGANGCTATAQIIVTQNTASPSAGITNNSGTTVLTCSQTSISVTATGGISYSWNGGATPTTAVNSFTSAGAYTVTVTGANGCTNTAQTTITGVVTPQPTWYLDADNDGYYTGSGVLSCDSPGEGYTTTVLPGGDCNDNDPLIHPGAAEICYDGIDNDCDGSLTNGCPAVTTTFWTSVCGQTLAGLNTSIRPYYTFSNNLPVGVLVTGYKFMITDLITNQVREVEKANGMIRITDTDIASYGRSYSIKVAIKLNAEWQPYNSENCTVTTPSIPTTTVSNCGTLAAINSPIYATSVANATRYRYTITLMGGEMNDVELESQTFTRTGNFVRLTELTTVPILYNAIYKVNVSAESLLGGVLTFSAPGTCYMSSPAEPVLQYESCQNGGLAPSSMTTPLYVTPYTGSPMYRYIVENEISGYSQTIETITRYVRLSQFNALAPLQAGGTYRIRIQIQLYGVYYEGKDCEVTVPGGSSSGSMPSRVMEQSLEAVAYPNPFANNFQLNIKTTNTSAVSIKVYDMLGRLIEQREETVNELETTTIGDNYPSGVYNIILSQADEVKTLRVVKR
ncbi:T9SS type A sorting domain-containing protein [Flavobacterium capsici]|uniref:T9SS type A sorting domain-containing protein n=1 Tax=Flavobacterium capsici TaxID=3075618 RepID=A0AA96F0M2_9FLAO|nr:MULTISPECIES: T9SS type A sorting domain-containing protein [unclassified Flavobacterium]WNM20217.1 T9SS type A sorting domain-containing protein [Flavobacterium sp. PMR2A8]WNM21607.1 T9SS type A sorting domain-containing protein [Flavobacterium sp. PMTSA4]